MTLTHPLSILLISMSVFMIIGVPVSFSLILCSLLVIWVADLPLTVAVQQMFTGVNAFTLLALPFFFLAGNVMTEGGISERLVKLAMAMVGHLRGGLAHVNVVVGMFLSGISGSTLKSEATSESDCPPISSVSKRIRRRSCQSGRRGTRV